MFVGMDPGKTGGIAVIDETGDKQRVWPRPEGRPDLASLIYELSGDALTFAVIEKVNAFPGQGVVSVWSFSGNYHELLMSLDWIEVPYEEVPPGKWMKFFELGKRKGESKPHHKKRRVAKAQSLFPKVVIHSEKQQLTDGLADALLLAEYARRVRLGF